MNISSRRSWDYSFVTARCAVSRQTLSARLGLVVGLCAAAWGLLAPQTASAQGRLDAHYEATLAGIPVGKGSWTIEIGDDVFSASAQGGTAGLLKAFSGGTGSGASQGRIVNGALVANAYTATTTTQKKSETIRISLANGGVKDFSIDPAPPVDPGRIPVTDAHRKSVLDPMTGSLLRVPGNGEVLAPDSCRTGAGIFDGRMRYDLKLDYKRMETVKAEKGYHGPALVCAIYFNPVAGYIPDRPVIKYLANERRIEITFVPIAGTRVLVPFRMTIPTPFGLAMLEATSFVTSAMPPRVAKTN
ncbi:DUF3108 domain-containing protein [Bradyrhizobium sp. AZCC 1578]|uniref:DUF3108 domain-containing protein n=1 Tax=Bradyrhizobium sp. AZCC 1578 TaxID=3117027 RepID=UPI003FA5BE77